MAAVEEESANKNAVCRQTSPVLGLLSQSSPPHPPSSTPESRLLFPSSHPSQYNIRSILEIPAQQSLSPTQDRLICASTSFPSPTMMLPVIPQRWSVGTAHVSAGPRLSATQQAPTTRLPINSHHCRQRCPPAGSSYDLYGDAPPPYYSLRPSGITAMRSINAEDFRGTARAGRRVMSESCASPYYGHDDDFLANLAAIQLLSGCTAITGRQSGGRRCCCRIGCDGTACALEDLSLRMLSKELAKLPTSPVTIQATIHGGADGHISLESTDRVRMCAHCRSAPMTPPVSRERFPSEDLDRRLQSIADALHRDSCPNENSKKRLHTSEASRKEQSFTTDDTVDVNHPHHDHDNTPEVSVKSTSLGILGTLRNLQHKDRPKRWVFAFPSLDSSEMPPSSEAEVPVRCPIEFKA